MAKKMTSVRLGEDIVKKLDQLQIIEKQNAEKFNFVPKSRNEIIEQAVSEYYTIKLDKDSGTDYLTRMNLMIQDALKQQNHQRDMILNHILRYAMMSYEAAVTMLKNFRLSDEERPKDFEDAKNLVQNLDSIFEDSIFEKVAKELGEEVD